jgi:hypothetical protein
MANRGEFAPWAVGAGAVLGGGYAGVRLLRGRGDDGEDESTSSPTATSETASQSDTTADTETTTTPLADVDGIDKDTVESLAAAGFETAEDIEDADAKKLLAADGVTASLATHIKETVGDGETDTDGDEGEDDQDTDADTDESPAEETADEPATTVSSDEEGSDEAAPVGESTVADAFADECDPVITADVLDIYGPVHVYSGRTTEGAGGGHIYALAPEHADTESACDAFGRAVEQWQGLAHNPHIAEIRATGDEPRPWVAFDAGETRLSNTDIDEFSTDDRLQIVEDVAEALRTGGLYNYTHGAVRPDAIYVTTDGDSPTATVADWGVTTSVRNTLDERTVTPYTAPEQLDAPGVASSATDVYRLGAIAYYALTNDPPIDTDTTDRETLAATIREGPVPTASDAADLPAEVDDILARAMDTDPDKRYDSAYESRDALIAALR